MCVYGPVLHVLLPAQLSDPETELFCRLSDAAGMSICACQTCCFCGRVSGTVRLCWLKTQESSQLMPERDVCVCVEISAGHSSLQPHLLSG